MSSSALICTTLLPNSPLRRVFGRKFSTTCRTSLANTPKCCFSFMHGMCAISRRNMMIWRTISCWIYPQIKMKLKRMLKFLEKYKVCINLFIPVEKSFVFYSCTNHIHLNFQVLSFHVFYPVVLMQLRIVI